MESRARKESAEHILVCLSASPSNQKVIEAASRMAKAFRASLTALYVMPSDGNALPEADEARLRSNIRLAERCGAVITTITGDDIPLQIAEYARISGITRIVIGRSSTKRAALFGRPSLTDQLILTAPNTDIYIIPDSAADLKRNAAAHRSARHLVPSRKDILYILGLLTAATAIGFLFEKLGFSESNIITVYILAVLGISVLTVSRVSSAVSSLAGVLLFNYFFIEPRFSFHTYEAEYAVTFIVMFAASVITGTLASRLKANETRSAHEAFRAKVLFDTNQRLQKAGTAEEIRRVTAEQVTALLSRNIIIYAANDSLLDDGTVFTADQPEERSHFFEDKERAAAEEALRQGSRTGAGTDTFPEARGVYYAIRLGEKRFGVLGILPGRPAPEPFESSMVLSILGECALALENLRNAEEREQAAVLAQNEQLRANILRTVSHDIRTPLTSISGNASNLLSDYSRLDDDSRKQIFTDIYDDSQWLIRLVENLLSVSRIDNGKMNLHLTADVVSDVVEEALLHVDRDSSRHTILCETGSDLLLAEMDSRLISQVVINLVNNAVKYTPPGSTITVRTEKRDGFAAVSVTDNGPGIPEENREHLFDLFYTGKSAVADGRRGLGLGLALCRAIVEAHGGTIGLTGCEPSGCCFTFTLPLKEVPVHE